MGKERKQVEKKATTQDETSVAETPETSEVEAKGDELKGVMDDILDEIDDLLEENAEEFIMNYVQRGGE